MAREIKFRAWNKIDNVMYFNSRLDLFFRHMIYLNKEFDIMQYTGLKDKNGTEIYEGDIVKIQGPYFRKILEANFVVEYDVSRAWFGIADALHTVSLNTFDYEEDVEVIGNIYENPELLKQA